MKIHIVQKGDTLWKIAQKYGVQFEELKQINSQLSNPDMIMPGMKIKVPSTGTAKNTQMQSNTKVNFGSKKEAPIPGVTASPVKEMPKKEMVSPAPVKPVPIMQQPTAIKEQPKPMPQPAPVIPQMPQPIIPDVDINNYYMVNMSNMMAQKPQQMQPQPAPKPQPAQKPAPAPQPIVVKKEKKEKKEKPVQVQPYPVMAEGCVPITPVMPGTGFCPPMYPMYPPMYGPGPVQIQPMYGPGPMQIQPMPHHHHESSSWCEPQMHAWQYGEYMPVMHQQQWAPFYGGMPYNPGVYAQVPYISPHSMHHHIESSSSSSSSSSSGHHTTEMIQPTYYQATHLGTEMTNMPIAEEEEDCGCGGPKYSSEMDGEVNTALQPTKYYQPQMQQWDQVHTGESHSHMTDHHQMNVGQYGSAYQPQMSGHQADMYQVPMGGTPANMHPPQMGGTPANMHPPQMGGTPANMYPPQMGGTPANMYPPQMGGTPASMYQPQMGGNQPAMPQAQSNYQQGAYQMPMQPWQKGTLQPQMNPNQPNVFVPQRNYPSGNPVPFYGQDDYASEIGQMKNYSDAFDLPRYADESNE